MRGLGKTTTNLVRYRKRWEELMRTAASAPAAARTPAGEPPSHLSEVVDFGSNPGGLRMFTYVPDRLPPNSPLVVVLHGCTQTAADYDRGAGWSMLADRHGFALVLPEQIPANNPKTCFNWFQAGDTGRGRGEALSIRQMVARAVRDHDVDERRVFVTGLSAGGAMTAVMLATYPDVFAGGGIVAGLPYGSAGNVQEAFESMFQGRERPARAWGDLVRAASPHRGPWPKISIWHGDADATVRPMNADELIKQWTDVHGLPSRPSFEEVVNSYPRRVWRGASGEDLIESYTVTGMAHGTPLSAGSDESVGAAGAFLLDVGISSSYRIAQFWGLTGQRMARESSVRRPSGAAAVVVPAAKRAARPSADVPPRAAADAPRGGTGGERGKAGRGGAPLPIDVQGVITKALRAAGLMKS